MRLALLAVALAATAACSDPTIAIELHIPQRDAGVPESSLPADTSWRVSVIDARSIASEAGLDGDVTADCEHIEYGLVPTDVIDGARRASSGDDPTRISGVPRIGDKLFVAEGWSGNRRVAAGCYKLGTVDDDEVVPIEILAAPRIQEIGRANADPDPHKTAIIATAAWDDQITLGQRAVRFELYGTTGSLFNSAATTNEAGVVLLGCGAGQGLPDCPADETPSGPLQTVVRMQWADEPARGAAFHDFSNTTGSPVLISHTDRRPPRWTTGYAHNAQTDPLRWIAVAPHSRVENAVDTDVTTVVYGAGTEIKSGRFVTPGVEAVVLWEFFVWTELADGWYQLTVDGGLPTTPTHSDPQARVAREMHAVTMCEPPSLITPPTKVGLLIRHADNGPYVPYTAPDRDSIATSGPIFELAREINGTAANEQATIVTQLCATSTPGVAGAVVERLVIVQGATGLRAIRVRPGPITVLTDRKFPLPQVTAIGDYGGGIDSALVGALTTQTGPRIGSFRFTQYPFGNIDTAVPTSAVNAAVALAPTSMVVADLDHQPPLDVVALLPAPSGPRVQIVMGREVAFKPLSGVTIANRLGGANALDAHMVLEDMTMPEMGPDDGCLELAILSTEQVDVLSSRLVSNDRSMCAKR